MKKVYFSETLKAILKFYAEFIHKIKIFKDRSVLAVNKVMLKISIFDRRYAGERVEIKQVR